MPSHTGKVIKRRADLGPGKLGAVFPDIAFVQHGVELGRYTGERRGGCGGNGVEQVRRPITDVPLGPHGGRIADAFVLGVPPGLMGGQIGIGADADIGVTQSTPK